jgi:hypothetical protein
VTYNGRRAVRHAGDLTRYDFSIGLHDLIIGNYAKSKGANG